MEPPASLKKRQTISVKGTEHVTPNDTFTLVSYNILADCHVQMGDYSYTPAEDIEPQPRNELVLQELKFLDADVVCLQEVSPVVFTTVLEPELSNLGYKGFYIRRTNDTYDEGCATFYKSNTFKCVRSETSKMGELAHSNISKCSLSTEDVERSCDRYVNTPEVAIFTVLENITSGATVTVANIHVAFTDMLKPDVQSIQIASTRHRLMDISPGGPHVMCGDFNVFPDTPPYILAIEGRLGGSVIKQICNEAKLEEAELVPSFTSLLTSFTDSGTSMSSSYKELMGKEPEVTCVDNIWRCAPDFVFYRNNINQTSDNNPSSSLRPVEVLDTNSVTEILKAVPPSHVYPSDHMPLLVKFHLK